MSVLSDVDVAALGGAAGAAVVAVSRAGRREALTRGSATVDTPFRIASLTKPLTAVATVLAANAAGTDLDEPAVAVLPALHGSWAADRRLTVSHLLSQTSGLAATVDGSDVAALGDGDTAVLDAGRLVVGAGSARPPGQRWEYYNGNYFLAGCVVESLTGGTVEDALVDLVLRPWGLSRTTFDVPPDLVAGVEDGRPLAPSPYPRGRRPSGGLCSSVSDLLTAGERLLDRPGLLDRVGTPRTRHDDPMRYGYGWAVGPSGQLFLNGRLPGYRAVWLIVPEEQLVAVSLAAGSDALPAQARAVSAVQHRFTGDDLAAAIEAFAA